MNLMKRFVFLLLPFVLIGHLNAQIIPDLSSVNNEKIWNVYNRIVNFDKAENAIQFNAQPLDGVVWVKDLSFGDGVIELDIKGSDHQGRSFVGIAFHGLDEETYDGIYFRPFNFKSPERNSHSVQYISHPEKTWSYLRSNFSEQYENPVIPVPDPNDWFHAKIEIVYPHVKVYVNNSEIASLEIEQLSDRKTGWIGLWAGNNSDGAFKNLVIKKSK
ncbi:MAG: hypothetical protein CVU00_11810 [Bacteroidetes bacterium HGW-Bacteroidetes-17]|nr:MAG: hypothetical protein CVU00_11810 [Bacteroidetes bacterium HGW-Bacteroidetes-17]